MIEQKITIRTPSCVKSGLIDNEQAIAIEEHFTRLYNVFLNQSQDTAFTLRDVMGGNNRDWSKSPMQIVYEKYLREYNDEKIAYKRSARDAGWFLMLAVHNDSRKFTFEHNDHNGRKVRAYRLITE